MKSIEEMFSLRDQCAVVIGGKGKIGYPMTEALCSAGATVYIASPTSAPDDPEIISLLEKGYKVKAVSVNQADQKDIESLIEFTKKDTGMPTVLVNSGVYRPPEIKGRVDTPESWEASMEVNAKGLFVTCQSFAKAMAAHGGGSIINVSSIYGLIVPDPKMYEGTNLFTESDYPYNKGGMIMLSKYFASLFADKNVRVNCIAPGGLFNHQPEPFISNYIAKVPLGRMAIPEDLYGITIFLASKSSNYLTGTVIPVDGGITIR